MIRFILRSIVFYQRSHLVVMLAVAVSTAVIGGALIVGDIGLNLFRSLTTADSLDAVSNISLSITQPLLPRP